MKTTLSQANLNQGNQEGVFQLNLRSLSNIGKCDNFLENTFWKMIYFSKDIMLK